MAAAATAAAAAAAAAAACLDAMISDVAIAVVSRSLLVDSTIHNVLIIRLWLSSL